MEKVIAIKLDIDGGASLNELKLVEDELNDIEQSIKKINASGTGDLSKELDRLNKSTKDGKLTWAELGKAVEQYQNIAFASGKESPIGKEALKKAGQLKSEMDNLSRSVNSLATNGQQLNTALQMGTGVIAGYTAVQSVTALVGEENEELMETLVKLQAAQGALASIEQIRFALEKDSLIVLQAKTAWEKASAISTNLLAKANLFNATATTTSTGATRAFTVALLAVPLFLVIGALVLLYNNWDKVTTSISSSIKWISEARENFKALDVVMKGLEVVFAPVTLLFKGVTSALQALGIMETETEKKIRVSNEAIVEEYEKRGEAIDALIIKHKQLMDNTVSQFDRELKLMQAQGLNTDELERKKLATLHAGAQQELNLTTRRLNAYRKEHEARLKLGDLTTEQIQEEVDKIYELTEAVEASQQAMLNAGNDYAVFRAKLIEEDKKLSAERAKIRQQEKEAREKEFQDYLSELREENAQIEQTEVDRINAINEKKKQAELDFKAWQDSFKLEEKTLEEEIAQQEEEQELEEIEKGLEDYANFLQRKLSIKEQFSDLFKKVDKQDFENALALTNSLSAINAQALENDLANAGGNEAKKEQLRKESFEREKKLNLARVLINGALAFMNALTVAPLPVGIALAAGTVVSTALQVNTIKKQKYNSSGSVGSVTSSLGSISSSSSSDSGQTSNDQPLNTTSVSDIINNNGGGNPVLVVDDVNKVNENQKIIQMASTI